MSFSPVAPTGNQVLSHTIQYERGRYRVSGANRMELGAFATFAAARLGGG